ncbi:MAG: hypothetical protein AAF773_11215 [Cyanobacteria bacterium P01_D01_bin.115]
MFNRLALGTGGLSLLADYCKSGRVLAPDGGDGNNPRIEWRMATSWPEKLGIGIDGEVLKRSGMNSMPNIPAKTLHSKKFMKTGMLFAKGSTAGTSSTRVAMPT